MELSQHALLSHTDGLNFNSIIQFKVSESFPSVLYGETGHMYQYYRSRCKL